MNKRTFNIIMRAEKDFGFEYDMNDSLQSILNEATNVIMDTDDYDYIAVCERSKHYDHICWNDEKGFNYEADGQFISTDESKNTYFRKNEKGGFDEVAWFQHTEDDYVLMDYKLDTDGMKVALICK